MLSKNDFKIIEYNDKYAQKVADMWNKSGDGWGGYNVEKSAETIIDSENNSAHEKLFLAEMGDEIMGYCKLSIDHQDEGALYIDLLNVRPDMHGKKIGKALVLASVNQTIENGWPRLDLHTWDGNTKAVPLYKKCGFFWEKRDNSTHLINMIPTVLKTEAVEDFFKEADWYNDSKRIIEIKPDSRLENKFDYWLYSWEKNNKILEMEFCRRGRGLRKIETDKYSITATVENLNLVFGNNYKIKYTIVNKSNSPLEIEINGKNHKNIQFDYTKKLSLDNGKTELEAEFFVDKIEKDQEEWKSHPCVSADILINEKKAEFKIGIKPKFPLSVKLNNPLKINFTEIESVIYFDVENFYNEETTFSFQIPSIDGIEFLLPKATITLKAKEKKSIPVKFILTKALSYYKNIEITAKLKSGKTMVFNKNLSTAFFTATDMFYGELEKHYLIANGHNFLKLSKTYLGEAFAGDYSSNDDIYYFSEPKLGKPFSGEFEKKDCEKVVFEKGDNWVKMEIFYKSKDFEDVEFKRIFKLYANGMLKRWFELINTKAFKDKELFISDKMYMNKNKAIFPYKNKFISMEKDFDNDSDFWNAKDFTENWIYAKGISMKYGFIWPKEYSLKIAEGGFFFEYNISKEHTTKPIITTTNTFDDWHEVREFALKKKLEKENLTFSQEFLIENGNPFVTSDVKAKFIEYKNSDLTGKFNLSCNNHEKISQAFAKDDKARISNFSLKADENISIVSLDANCQEIEFNRKKVVFKVGDNKINTTILSANDQKVLKVDNGIISFKTAATFAPSVFSLKYNENEWLDSSFPNSCPKSWWNPWIGGISIQPSFIKMDSILQEESNAEFVKKKDNFGNTWEGIKISTKVKKNEENKGLVWNQFFLTLPNLPILMGVVEVENNTGKFINDKPFLSENSFRGDKDILNQFFSFKDDDDNTVIFKPGNNEKGARPKSLFELVSKSRDEKVSTFVNTSKAYKGIYIDKELANSWIDFLISCKDKESKFSTPFFFILSEKTFEKEWLKDLNNIKFE